MRQFNQSLADVSTMLSGESDELSAALANLSTALSQVGTFVEENKASLGRNITGLNRVAKILVKRRSELDQILRIAPVALTNLALAYNPDTGTLDTNANLGNLEHELQSDPGRLLCALVSANDDRGAICDLIQGLLPPAGVGITASRLRRVRQTGPEAGLPEQVRPLAERAGDGPMMRKKLAAGVALLISSVVLSGCDFDVYQLPLPGGTDVGDDPMSITVEFRDVLDLVPQSTVKVNDVNVGKVTDVELDGYTAKVTLELQKDTDLPDNAIAEIRQTSLLGEKFVSLSSPTEGASDNPLGDSDIIPLERSGRNPEVEEVLGALSLVLNGGGVAQLKTIASELNLALEGREDSAKSVLTQIDSLMGQLDDNRTDIVNAIDSLDRLASSAREQQDSIDAALVELPSALASIDGQREDLVEMLGALNRLGDVGVRVIKASKESTIEAVRQLQPVLTELANSGDAFVDSFNVALTFPFVDEVVGRDPQVARNLHMGDFTNLSITLELDLTKPLLPGVPCTALSNLPGGVSLDDLLDLPNLCAGVSDALTLCANNPTPRNCAGIPRRILNQLCDSLNLPALCNLGGLLGGLGGASTGNNAGLGGLGQGGLGGILDGFGLGGLLPRAAFNPGSSTPGDTDTKGPTMEQLMSAYDPGLVSMLVSPMVVQP